MKKGKGKELCTDKSQSCLEVEMYAMLQNRQ